MLKYHGSLGCISALVQQATCRKRHSCETQLTTVINDWVKILDKRGQVDTFILDFEKAFDTPPHELLKSKLFGYALAERHSGGQIPFFAIEHNELL